MGNSGRYNHKTVYQDGYKFDSKLERDFYLELLDRKAKGLIKGFKMQVKYPLQPRFIILDGQAITDDNPDFDKIRRKNKLSINSSIDYIADFVVENAENKIIVYDTKGLLLFSRRGELKDFSSKTVVIKEECMITVLNEKGLIIASKSASGG